MKWASGISQEGSKRGGGKLKSAAKCPMGRGKRKLIKCVTGSGWDEDECGRENS